MQRPEAKNQPERPQVVTRDEKEGTILAEMPTETTSFESARKSAVWKDWMVVRAVRCEPVSTGDSLLTGKLTGYFSVLGH